jgi:hypothetical protein
MNGTHIDRHDHKSYKEVFLENPTYSEFSISYNMFGNFLEEVYDSYLHNATTSVRGHWSYLINISTRFYVNEQGISSNDYAIGYIDPREVSVGSSWMGINNTNINVTKEIVNVVGMDREAWKLGFNSESENQSYHYIYDVMTGIFLSSKFEISGGLMSGEQFLISTNTWPTSRTTTFPLFEIMLLACVLTFVIKKKII